MGRVGLAAGAQFQGDKGEMTATVEKSFKDVKAEEFDALFEKALARR